MAFVPYKARFRYQKHVTLTQIDMSGQLMLNGFTQRD